MIINSPQTFSAHSPGMHVLDLLSYKRSIAPPAILHTSGYYVNCCESATKITNAKIEDHTSRRGSFLLGVPIPKTLKLVERPNGQKQNNGLDYIAISHCWGSLTEEEEKQFCTTTGNCAHRLEGFTPKVYRRRFGMPFEVTQQLGKECL